MNRDYLPALTGFRAIAALSIFLFHYRSTFGWLPDVVERVWLTVTSELHLGVSLFFTLSGFLLCRRYYASSWSSRPQYLLQRFARVYPLFFLLTTANYLFGHSLKSLPTAEWWQQYLLNITLLKGFASSWHLTGISQTWSLTVEECFYLLLPLLFWLAHRYSLRIWIVCVLGLLVLGLGLSQLLQSVELLETTEFTLLATFFGRSAEFLIGAAFARLPVGRLPNATNWAILAGLTTLCLLICIAQLLSVSSSIESLPGVAVNNWILPWSTGLLLYGLTTQNTWLSKWLSSHPLQVLGRSSYAFYLLHMGLFADFVQGRLHRHLPQLPPLFTLLVLVILASIVLHYLVEKPLHRLIVRQLQVT